eukprot:Rmarinus@m.13368
MRGNKEEKRRENISPQEGEMSSPPRGAKAPKGKGRKKGPGGVAARRGVAVGALVVDMNLHRVEKPRPVGNKQFIYPREALLRVYEKPECQLASKEIPQELLSEAPSVDDVRFWGILSAIRDSKPVLVRQRSDGSGTATNSRHMLPMHPLASPRPLFVPLSPNAGVVPPMGPGNWIPFLPPPPGFRSAPRPPLATPPQDYRRKSSSTTSTPKRKKDVDDFTIHHTDDLDSSRSFSRKPPSWMDAPLNEKDKELFEERRAEFLRFLEDRRASSEITSCVTSNIATLVSPSNDVVRPSLHDSNSPPFVCSRQTPDSASTAFDPPTSTKTPTTGPYMTPGMSGVPGVSGVPAASMWGANQISRTVCRKMSDDESLEQATPTSAPPSASTGKIE